MLESFLKMKQYANELTFCVVESGQPGDVKAGKMGFCPGFATLVTLEK